MPNTNPMSRILFPIPRPSVGSHGPVELCNLHLAEFSSSCLEWVEGSSHERHKSSFTNRSEREVSIIQVEQQKQHLARLKLGSIDVVLPPFDTNVVIRQSSDCSYRGYGSVTRVPYTMHLGPRRRAF